MNQKYTLEICNIWAPCDGQEQVLGLIIYFRGSLFARMSPLFAYAFAFFSVVSRYFICYFIAILFDHIISMRKPEWETHHIAFLGVYWFLALPCPNSHTTCASLQYSWFNRVWKSWRVCYLRTLGLNPLQNHVQTTTIIEICWTLQCTGFVRMHQWNFWLDYVHILRIKKRKTKTKNKKQTSILI